MDNAPKLPTHLADAAEQRPTMPRIPGIGAGNRPSDLGFQESDLDGTHMMVLVFGNPSRKRTRFGWISRI
jgi:hypothetical protein